MTYGELAKAIEKMTDKQKNMDVTLNVIAQGSWILLADEEFYRISGIQYTDDNCDTLDPDHPVLTVSA